MATPSPLPLIERPQVAELLGVKSLITIAKWEQEGLPIAKAGRPGLATKYDAPAVVAWFVAREVVRARGMGEGALDPATERARKDRARAELDETKLAGLRGEVLSRSIYDQELAKVLVPFRAAVLAAPRAWAPQLAQLGREGPGSVARALTELMRKLLTNLASLRVGDETRLRGRTKR